MKHSALILLAAAITAAASAQTTSGTPTTTKSAAAPASTTAAKTSTTATSIAKSATASSSTTTPPWIKLPPGIPKVVHGPLQTPVALHYEDIKVGTGPEGESGKVWHIKYTGWRASDGVKFDSWDDHTQPVLGKDGKPELGPDGKTKMSDPQPMTFPQGIGRVIPGFDTGLAGMKVGGKRRIFIPWQLAYGTRNLPDRPDHPGIPAKSDLIFDVELVEVTDMPAPPQMRPGMLPGARPGATGQPGAPGSAPAASAAPSTTTAAPAAKPVVPTPPQPATSPAATAPAQPATPPASSTPAQPSAAPQPK